MVRADRSRFAWNEGAPHDGAVFDAAEALAGKYRRTRCSYRRSLDVGAASAGVVHAGPVAGQRASSDHRFGAARREGPDPSPGETRRRQRPRRRRPLATVRRRGNSRWWRHCVQRPGRPVVCVRGAEDAVAERPSPSSRQRSNATHRRRDSLVAEIPRPRSSDRSARRSCAAAVG